ncbi:VWA domain-containing protein [Dongia soli]|uniref:VWA domain-containing protein n=1 Tax=Dongia soli TaxID=600628 RepID=A0ABU5E7H8_9PROT|nr:VWA domain-containing protein [Dongia soli]MDY0882257.1 VWA domain-containing protein [Dongia soli]
MFAGFITALRNEDVPVSLTEYLTLIGALKSGVVSLSVEDFYFLARATLVKDERRIDRFDRVFAVYFKGLEAIGGEILADIPEEWLRKLAERYLTPEEMAAVQSLGGWDKLMETLRQRLAEQQKRHQGGNKWIGTAGTSPFGAYGYNPEGIRIGQDGSRHRSAVKVWDKREFRDLDGDVELGTRSIKLALRRLRRWGREGEATELDLGGTIGATARNGGSLDLKLRPERRNKVKVLLLLDIGGSMDDHVEETAQLFSAAKSEFKHLETFYFHNCPYERLWRSNRRRFDAATPTLEVMRTYGPDWSLILVGDATMSPYEITVPGGSVEHWNEESGQIWLERLLRHYPRSAWINPRDQQLWGFTQSLKLIDQLMGSRMFPLTLDGIDDALRALRHRN